MRHRAYGGRLRGVNPLFYLGPLALCLEPFIYASCLKIRTPCICVEASRAEKNSEVFIEGESVCPFVPNTLGKKVAFSPILDKIAR